MANVFKGLTSFISDINPLIGIGTQVLGAITGDNARKDEQRFNAQQAELNRQFQTNERLATQSFNQQMWHMNNEYNSPAAQVDRLLAAGINPNSVFDSGGSVATSSPISSSPMSGGAASYSSSFGSSLLSASSQAALNLAQVEKIQSETDNNRYELSWNKMTEKERFDSLKNMNEQAKASIAKIFSDIGMNDFSKDIQERTFSFFAQKSTAEIKVMNEQLNLLRNQSLEVLKNIDLKDAQILDTLSSANLKSEQSELVNSQTTGQDINNALQGIALKFTEITGIPIGTPEEQALFALWTQGRWQELSEKVSINSYNSDNPISKAAGAGGVLLNKVGRGLESLVNSIGQVFTK